jgi:hypothetical protein
MTGRWMNMAVRFMPAVVSQVPAGAHQGLNSKRRAPKSSGYKNIRTYVSYNMARKGYWKMGGGVGNLLLLLFEAAMDGLFRLLDGEVEGQLFCWTASS